MKRFSKTRGPTYRKRFIKQENTRPKSVRQWPGAAPGTGYNEKKDQWVRWYPPRDCSFEMNIDGSLSGNKKIAGGGGVLKDSSGN